MQSEGSGYLISAVLKYQGVDKNIEKYSCKYIISKPKTHAGVIHIRFLSSNLEIL
jgi:hypothetical protein